MKPASKRIRDDSGALKTATCVLGEWRTVGLYHSHNTVSDIRIGARFDEKRLSLVNP